MNPVLEVRKIDKRFPGVHAVDGVSFACYPGTVHILEGENGAGKSTILKMLCGLYTPDFGEIYVNGEKVSFLTPLDAQKKNISMVYQEMTVLPNLTVAENIFLNREKECGKGSLWLNEMELIQAAMRLSDQYGIPIDPYALVGDLPIAQCQMVEILRALALEPDVLILDEPTATLTKTETQKLFAIIRGLTQKGKAIIFISHRLEEVMEIGETMTILKDGKLVANIRISDASEDEIVRMMVGRELEDFFPPKLRKESSDIIFQIEGLSDRKNFWNIDLALCRGEVVGIAALEGQGQTELLRALAGAGHCVEGKIYLGGRRVAYKSVRQALRLGIGYVPEDRKRQALCLRLPVRENLALASLNKRSNMGFVDHKKESETVDRQIAAMNIRTPSPEYEVEKLSGGNQQKIAIGKVLACQPRMILMNEPTRGIDVEAKQEIYKLVRKLADAGTAVLIYTSDMMEVIGLCDRVATIFEGKITGQLSGVEITEENIMRGVMNLAPLTQT